MKKLSDQHNSHTLVGCLLTPPSPHAAIPIAAAPASSAHQQASWGTTGVLHGLNQRFLSLLHSARRRRRSDTHPAIAREDQVVRLRPPQRRDADRGCRGEGPPLRAVDALGGEGAVADELEPNPRSCGERLHNRVVSPSQGQGLRGGPGAEPKGKGTPRPVRLRQGTEDPAHEPPRLPLGGRAAPVYRRRHPCHQPQDQQDDEHLRQGEGGAWDGLAPHCERAERPRSFRAIVKGQGTYLPEADSPSSKTLRFASRCLGGASSSSAFTTRSRSSPGMPMPLAAPRMRTFRKR